jgi:hypothetical protein
MRIYDVTVQGVFIFIEYAFFIEVRGAASNSAYYGYPEHA